MEANFVVTEFGKKWDPQTKKITISMDLVRSDKGKGGIIQLRNDDFFEVDTGDEFVVMIIKKPKPETKVETK